MRRAQKALSDSRFSGFELRELIEWNGPAPAGNRPGIGQATEEPDVTNSIPIDDDTLKARVSLATEMILTSGIIMPEDITRGWYDQPNPADRMQQMVILLGITIICGGIDGAPIEEIADAWDDKRILTAAIEAMLEAVEIIRADAA